MFLYQQNVMIKILIKSLIFFCILYFFYIIFNYYFSEKNINIVKTKEINLETKILENISNLPILYNDTNDVIEFNSGFENSNKQNFKRSFWELFK